MKSFEEFIKDKDESLQEATTARPEAVVAREIKREFKLTVALDPFKPKGNQSHPIKPDGTHGLLCSHYDLKVSSNRVSNKEHGEYWAAVASLSWDYKNGGSNGKDMLTIWVGDDGKLIGIRHGY